MLILQVYADRKKEDEGEDSRQDPRFGMRLRKVAAFLKAHLEGGETPLEAAEVASAVRQAEKYFDRNNLSGFMSSLTPGAQNAIYAGSYLWGYENAAKYVKNAMKLAQEKNMGSIEGKSQEVLQSVQQQASGLGEKLRESEKIIWTYYNESLRDFQAQSAKTEIMVDKPALEREHEMAPLTAKDAVAQSLEAKSTYPSLLYCTSMREIERELSEQQSAAIAERKREEIVRLAGSQEKISKEIKLAEKEARIITPDIVRDAAQKNPTGAVSEAELASALRRHGELIAEYGKTEKQILQALEQLEAIREGDEARLKGIIEGNLPPGLSQIILREKKLLKRISLQKQLKKWLAACRKGRSGLLRTTPARIAKLLSLSALLRK